VGSDQASTGTENQYWFNVATGTVQTNYDKGQGKNLMGPYPTHEQAQNALRSAAERTEKWDDEDRRWREGDED
jgi:hypothetical protein